MARYAKKLKHCPRCGEKLNHDIQKIRAIGSRGWEHFKTCPKKNCCRFRYYVETHSYA